MKKDCINDGCTGAIEVGTGWDHICDEFTCPQCGMVMVLLCDDDDEDAWLYFEPKQT